MIRPANYLAGILPEKCVCENFGCFPTHSEMEPVVQSFVLVGGKLRPVGMEQQMGSEAFETELAG